MWGDGFSGFGVGARVRVWVNVCYGSGWKFMAAELHSVITFLIEQQDLFHKYGVGVTNPCIQ